MKPMDPLQLLIASSTKIVLLDDNARSHAVPVPVHKEPANKSSTSPCRWQSSPVNVRKPGILSTMGKRGGLPVSARNSLKSLVAPIQRQRTIPLLDLDNDTYLNESNEKLNDEFIKEEALELNKKITKASELLSEYLRVATEELCLDYSSSNNNGDDDRTISTATVTSHSTTDSNASERSMGSLTRNVRKPVRQRSRDNLMV